MLRFSSSGVACVNSGFPSAAAVLQGAPSMLSTPITCSRPYASTKLSAERDPDVQSTRRSAAVSGFRL